ncbi:hypothetical protein [Paenibacillus sp. RC67]|uniref:hypothetical protein n=1 Tax=Paenibacillus sp. RC67 TaxID=3039392 RepID=UPI0024AE0C71|nr:hypothetical protein [Paenibacillus sp. RC67]
MFEVQEIVIHEWIPYLISISLICSFTYVYLAHFHEGAVEGLFPVHHEWVPILPKPEPIGNRVEKHHWLTRRVKRKEAPDGDSDDCYPSFGLKNDIQRGGLLWAITVHSPISKNTVYSRLLPH